MILLWLAQHISDGCECGMSGVEGLCHNSESIKMAVTEWL